jgi:hypothetical protein
VANALELDIELSPRWSLNIAIDVLVPAPYELVVRDQEGAVIATHDLAAASAMLAVGPTYQF